MDLNTQRMSRAESKARTREALLGSARAVFAENGFNAATVEEIAAGAGFTRGAFYANFADKSDAFWAVAKADDEAVFGILESDLEAADDDDDKLAMLDRWFEVLLGERPLRQAYAEQLAQVQSDADRQRFADLMAANRRRIARVLEVQAELYGVTLGAPAEHLASIFLAVEHGLEDQRMLDEGAVPVSLITDAFAYVWLGATVAADDPLLVNRGSGTPSPGSPGPDRRRS